MEFDLQTTEKLWGIVSRLPFESKYLIELKRETKINPALYFGTEIQHFVLELGCDYF